ncbi:penicillin-binding protein activator LpoB [Desulfurispirillum indicum]|uniref:Penicillin-binding protein activator LpoB n=1 Tax=Desulfurispirillum indicum (strain ATCC BAA-1389 / DSM 22839 / S5) TaxID=653733 RepID=E6W062_DESIS|nr:penicillin-binding protein activator LpoB [Desulfurispirillum indicum]ADU65188.1 hypothetical protein Selin_0435 [Desulfurispirillum indicum S5]UCZ57078.1 penicillin-binding protein activator LpoB [Desulfurispirillum indicum]
MHRAIRLLLTLMTLTLILAGCSQKVSRIDLEETRDLSGNWNDTDSRLVSREMVGDVLSQRWLPNFVESNNRQPTVIVGSMRNLSHEHINMRTFISDIQRELINSGRVDFVASAEDRTDLREERRDQDLHAREETRSRMGQEIGADYMLSGTINTIIDVEGRTQVKYYQVDLSLTDLESNRIVWIGQKKIRKLIERSRVRS